MNNDNNRPAFLTGSQVYGVPTDESDYDMVLRCSKQLKEFLAKTGGMPIRFGKLNIVATTSDAEYDKWKRGTELLKNRLGGPATRSEAVEVFKGLGIGGTPSE